jgi:TPR repeat protein
MSAPKEQYNLYELLQKADSGDLDAMDTAADILFNEGYLEDDPDGEIAARLIKYRIRSTLADGPFQYIVLGEMFLNGKGLPQDTKEALRWFKKAVKIGIYFGNECIGMMHFQGNGVPVDYQKAYEYFTKDPVKKSFCTTYALGEMYRLGLYVKQDAKKACELYRSIVEDNDSFSEYDDYYWRACFRLGEATHYGLGTGMDPDKAAELISKAKRIYEKRYNGEIVDGITDNDLFNSRQLK